MELNAPVTLKGVPRSFDEYRATVRREQRESLQWLLQPDLDWRVPHALKVKVDDDGSLRSFHGDTVTLLLAPGDAARLHALQSSLRRRMA